MSRDKKNDQRSKQHEYDVSRETSRKQALKQARVSHHPKEHAPGHQSHHEASIQTHTIKLHINHLFKSHQELIQLTKQHKLSNPRHKIVIAYLGAALASNISEFARAPSSAAFATFKTQCESAIHMAELEFKHDPGIWRSVVMPIANYMLDTLNSIAKYIAIDAKHHFALFDTRTQAERMWQDSGIQAKLTHALKNPDFYAAVHSIQPNNLAFGG